MHRTRPVDADSVEVPFLDLKRQFASIEAQVRQRVDEVLEGQQFVLGEPVEWLERELARYLDVSETVGVASGTDALLLALRTLDLEPGDEVVTTPFTFFATAGAIHHAGGRIVFADIEPRSFNLDPSSVEAAVGSRTRAILPVHLFGQMADMERLGRVADREGVMVIEDAAQAIGSRRRTTDGRWEGPGSASSAAAFSFFPSKNLGAYGDGGLVVTSDPDRARRIRRLRVHGGLKMYRHDEVGVNSRLDTLQAAILLAKLPYLDVWNERRRENAEWYHEHLEPLEQAGFVARPIEEAGNRSSWHQYTLRCRDRDRLREHLKERGVQTAVYYPTPLHLQPCFEDLGYRNGDFPEAERACSEVLALPIYPELEPWERERVVSVVLGFYGA